jgi:tetratricopeptide (TPR) repeat protein
MNKKIVTIIGVVIAATGLILGLLYYYQSQGYIKIFPTAEDREIARLLTIDRSKFAPAQGLSNEQFEKKIQELEQQKQAVLQAPDDAQAWFLFGHTLEFLNDHAGAAAVWEKVYQLQPLNFVATLNLANVYQYFLKDYSRAEFYYKKTLELQSGLTAAYQGLIDLYAFNLKEKQAELEPTIKLAAQRDATNAGKYYATYAEFLVRNGETAKAKDYADRAKALDTAAYQDLIAAYPVLK